jgi:fatty-acyl-CoA synthase
MNSSPWMPGHEPAPGRLARGLILDDAHRSAVEQHRPYSLLPAETLHACIAYHAERDPRKVAMRLLDRDDPLRESGTLDYTRLLDRVERAALVFADAAGGATPVVSVMAPMVPDALVASWAASTVGVANPLNPFLEVEAIATILRTIGTQVLVAGGAGAGAGAWQRLDEIVAAVPTLKRVLRLGEEFDAALAAVDRSRFGTLRRRGAFEDSTWMPTGGTTGAPKLARHTQAQQLLNAWLFGAAIGPGPDEVVGHGLPNFHVGGLVCLALRTILYGQTLVTLTPEGFRNAAVVKRWWQIVERFGLTNSFMTPTTAAMLLAEPDPPRRPETLHTLGCGGSAVPTEIASAFERRFGLQLREGWGMTEAHGVLSGHPRGRAPIPGAIGERVAFHELRVATLDGNRFVSDCGTGERGIIIVRGPCVSAGYHEAPAATEALFVQGLPPEERWASTGDIGSRDAQGQHWIHGREKDLIIRGGHNLDPRVIEEALAAHEAVQIAAAIGRPDRRLGELPIAYVQLKPGRSASPADLIAFCAGRIPERAAMPVEVLIVPAIPLTAVGKIAKPLLRRETQLRELRRAAATVIGDNAIDTVWLDDTQTPDVAVLRLKHLQALPAGTEERLRAELIGFSFRVRIE